MEAKGDFLSSDEPKRNAQTGGEDFILHKENGEWVLSGVRMLRGYRETWRARPVKAHDISITNKTDKRIMVMAMYPGSRDDDKKDWWPLVPSSQIESFKQKATQTIGDKPAFSLETFDPRVYKGRANLRTIADSMTFHDKRELDHFIGVMVFDKDGVKEVYSRHIKAGRKLCGRFQGKRAELIISMTLLPCLRWQTKANHTGCKSSIRQPNRSGLTHQKWRK